MSNIGTGNKGRFSDRIKKIKFYRNKKKYVPEDVEIATKNILKVVAVIPMMVAENIFDKVPKEEKKNDLFINNKEENKKDNEVSMPYLQKKKINHDKIEKINISTIKKDRRAYLKSINTKENKKVQEEKKKIEKEEEQKKLSNGVVTTNPSLVNKTDKGDFSKQELEKKIINLIKKDLVKTVNQLEIYESELYILNEINTDEKTLQECKENIAAVKKILTMIEKLKEKYDYLRDNYDFEYLLETDNQELIDRIVELKNKVTTNDIRNTVADYKLLEVYKYLYLEIDNIHEKTIEIEKEKSKKEEELKKRDIDFDKLKGKVYNVDTANASYLHFVAEQNDYLNKLSNKLRAIDSKEVVNYHMKGFGQYLFGSLKYFGLLMLNPLKGLMPSIVGQTLVAKNMVGNLRNGLKWEKQTRMVYDAFDYSNSLSIVLKDLNTTGRMVDSTIEDLSKLKSEYYEKYMQYHGDFLEYREVFSKITSVQEALINNKIKIELMKNRVKSYSKQNNDKLVLVRKLNEEESKR